MPLRPMYASAFLALVVVASLLLVACSSSKAQDVNYGTDVAVGFVPPDGGYGPEAVSAASEVAREVSSTLADAADGGIAIDSSPDEGD
jgi:hypothetical protein